MPANKLDQSLDSIIATQSNRSSKSRGIGFRVREDRKRPRHDHETTEPITVGRRIFVGNLSFKIGWQDLKDTFRACGNVIHAKILQNQDGRSKGCGIVEFETAEEAAEAINTLHDTELNGRLMFIREDREDFELRDERPVQRQKQSAAYRKEMPAERTGEGFSNAVFVNNLPWDITSRELEDHFRQCGDVISSSIMQLPGGRSKGCGLVTFSSPQGPKSAIKNLHLSTLGGREILVREDREPRNEGSFPAAGTAKVEINNLSYSTVWQTLKDFFNEDDEVIRAEILYDPDGRPSGKGYVIFHSIEAAQAAMSRFNGSSLEGRPIKLRLL